MKGSARVLLTVLLAVGLSAAGAEINRIVVRSTTMQEISKDLVLSNILSKEGLEFSRSQLSEDIKRLYQTGHFDDVEAKVERLAGDQVDLVFTLTPKPRVADVVFQGNRRLSDRALAKKVGQKKDEFLDEGQLAEDLRDLYDYYHDKGYHDVTIKQTVERSDETQTVNIIYEIEEKGRFKTRGVRLVGNTVFSSRKLKRKMKTDVSFWGRIFPVGFFSETELSEDLDMIRGRYLDKGYLDFKVEQVEREVNAKGTLIYLTIHLKEGEPYTVRDVSVSGNKALDDATLRALLSLKPGATYSRSAEQADVQALTRRYNHDGYLDSAVIPNTRPDRNTHTLTTEYDIVEGVPSSIRNVNISGNKVTKDHVIRRELQIHPGDKSDSTLIQASKLRLMNLGYFESVETIPVSTEQVDEKDLNVQVVEKPTGRLLLSAGFSSTDDVLAAVEVAQSNFDLGNPWSFRGGGQRMRVRAQVGSSRQDYVVSFTEPWLMNRPLRLDVDLWNRSVSSNREYDQDATGGGLRLTKKLKWPFWRFSVGYRLEDIGINDMDTGSYSAPFIAAEEGSELVSALSMGLVRDHRDRLVRTSSGSRLSLQTELQGEFIGSYSNLLNVSLAGDKYLPIFKRTVLKLSGEITQVHKLSGDEPHIFDRLFTGGAYSIRGFKERSVGPVDILDQEPVGGKSLLLLSAEARLPLYEDTIYWALFADAGNVWEDSFQYDLGEINVGAGIGVRLFLPIGIISIDYGWPVVQEQDSLDGGGRLHFNLGYNF